MEEDKGAEASFSAYLLQQQDELECLERFPRSSYTQAAILTVSVPVLLADFFGLSILPVPAYLLLPFVVLPGLSLLRRERAWRVGQRTIRKRIQLVEHRRRAD